jgi:hypothetical protein
LIAHSITFRVPIRFTLASARILERRTHASLGREVEHHLGLWRSNNGSSPSARTSMLKNVYALP